MVWVLVAATLGSVLGALGLYWAGAALGTQHELVEQYLGWLAVRRVRRMRRMRRKSRDNQPGRRDV